MAGKPPPVYLNLRLSFVGLNLYLSLVWSPGAGAGGR